MVAMGPQVLQRGDTGYSGTASIAMRQKNCYGANVCNVATRLATSSVYKKDQKVSGLDAKGEPMAPGQ